MKAHTQTFKDNLTTLGKEIDVKVTYTIDGVETELDGDNLSSVTPHYEGNILKSVMKQVDIVSDVDIPIGTIINVQFGMRYNTDEYEYIDYGNYIVNKSEKQEDTNNYKIIAYDKMLYAMKDYEELEIEYPITIRNYINAICTKIGLEFANNNEVFCNYDKQITQELYKDLGYTYRDVLDELAQVTASTICINDNDQLEIRYLNESVNDSEEVEGTNLTLSNSESARINGVVVEGETTQDGTPTPDNPQEVKNITGLQDIQVCGKNLAQHLVGWINNQGVFKTSTDDCFYFYVVQGETYIYNTSGNRTICGIFENIPSNNNTCISGTYNGSFKKNTPFVASATGYMVIYANTPSSQTVINDFIAVKGNTIGDYEPYIGNTYEINLGKNLFDINGEYSGGTLNKYNNGFILTKSSNRVIRFILPQIQQAGTYTISFDTINYVHTITNSFFVSVQYGSGNTTIVQNVILNNNNIATFTATSEFNRLYFFISNSESDTATITIDNIQLEKGSSKTSYSEYFTPIELNKISTYKDLIFKGKGINLFNKDNATIKEEYAKDDNGNETANAGGNYTTSYTKVKPNTTYTFNYKLTSVVARIYYYDKNKDWISRTSNIITSTNKYTFTTPNNCYYIQFQNVINFINGETQLQEGNEILLYEPYGSKGKWLLHKEIGKYNMVDISNDIQNVTYYMGNFNSTNGYMSFRLPKSKFDDYNLPQNRTNISSGYCNALKSVNAEMWNNLNYLYRFSYTDGLIFTILYTDIGLSSWTTASRSFKTELDTYLGDVVFYLPLATPTTEKITNDNYPELLSQLKALDKAKTYESTTNITSSFPIKFSYATDYETINEDYIKNTRASFGEKYGPINSIVLSRSADSDNVYLRDEDNIDKNGLCEVKIKDNQIMNDNNRSVFLPDLLEYLKGIEYYINDFESIGITYLDLLDRYKVTIGDKNYYCIMLNDEVEIHDGLNEIIYTEKPKENVTDYKKASTTDKLQRQTNLIVDKQNQKIEAIVSESEDNFATINVELGRISSQVQGYDVTFDELGNEIQSLRTSYTEQTPTMISDWFDTNLKSIVDDLQNTTSGNDEEIRKIKAYIRRGVINDPQSPYYNQAYIELGDETNQTTLRILQNRIQFLTNGQETAFISNNQLYINESTILTKEKIGNWVTTQDEDGLLNTYWED